MHRTSWTPRTPEDLLVTLAMTLSAIATVGFALVGVALVEPQAGPAGGLWRMHHEALPSWLLGATWAVLPSSLLLAAAVIARSATQRSLRQLLDEARSLDRNHDPGPARHHPLMAAAEELSVAMRLSALRLQRQLQREHAFSSEAAHQLRTPLAGLRLQLEELVMQPGTPRRVRAELQACLKEIDRLAGITSDLLALARNGALPAASHSTDLAVAAVQARLRWARAAAAAGRELKLSHAPVPCHAPAPAAPIGQVLDVLIDNALKHGTGTVEISVDPVGGHGRIRVADQGRIGTTATRAGSTPAEPRPVSEGIGLPLAERLADALGGQLSATRHPRTAYDLLLPAHTPASRRPTPARNRAGQHPAHQLHRGPQAALAP